MLSFTLPNLYHVESFFNTNICVMILHYHCFIYANTYGSFYFFYDLLSPITSVIALTYVWVNWHHHASNIFILSCPFFRFLSYYGRKYDNVIFGGCTTYCYINVVIFYLLLSTDELNINTPINIMVRIICFTSMWDLVSISLFPATSAMAYNTLLSKTMNACATTMS